MIRVLAVAALSLLAAGCGSDPSVQTRRFPGTSRRRTQSTATPCTCIAPVAVRRWLCSRRAWVATTGAGTPFSRSWRRRRASAATTARVSPSAMLHRNERRRRRRRTISTICFRWQECGGRTCWWAIRTAACWSGCTPPGTRTMSPEWCCSTRHIRTNRAVARGAPPTPRGRERGGPRSPPVSCRRIAP